MIAHLIDVLREIFLSWGMDAEAGTVASTAAAVLVVVGVYAGSLWGIAFVVRRTLPLPAPKTGRPWRTPFSATTAPWPFSAAIL